MCVLGNKSDFRGSPQTEAVHREQEEGGQDRKEDTGKWAERADGAPGS